MNYSAALDGCISSTHVVGLKQPYRGKVRDVYQLNDQTLAIVSTDRISAFDHVLRQPIPFKGQILNTLAAFFFHRVEDIVSTHLIDIPHPNVSIVRSCKPLPVEVVIRGYLTGHAWRTYKSGQRELCGVHLSDGLRENEKFTNPILTPATKATHGHDEDISEMDILENNIVDEAIWSQVRSVAFRLFKRGTQIAAEKGLILVDTKYEFGISKGELVLIDEVHTPDSSRYFYSDTYLERLNQGLPQKQLSKEFVREWLIGNDFQGLEGQVLPDLSDDLRIEIFERYAELFKVLTGLPFTPVETVGFNEILPGILNRYIDL
jgi:phosphoribosylaminoimidazole-succinocarboxamide synthase